MKIPPPKFKVGDRVKLKEPPCLQCPPWAREYLKTGATGKVTRQPIPEIYAYRVFFEGLSVGFGCDVCPRHVELA